MNFPTMEEVETASHEQLARWSRFLPSADDAHRAVQDRIYDRFNELGGWDPTLSKRIGWD